MFKINLVPEIQIEKKKSARRNALATFFAIAVVSISVTTLVILAGVRVARDATLSGVDQRIAAVDEESEEYRELEEAVISLEKGLAGLRSILSGENTWTNLLPHLERATPSEVQFESIKLEGNTLSADLRGRDVNSLARMINSYKEYQVVAVSGRAKPGDEVSYSVGGEFSGQVNTKPDGTWNFALSFDPERDQLIMVLFDEEELTLEYSAEDKTISSSDEKINFRVADLFSNIRTTEYRKEDRYITFDLSLNFDSEAIW